MQAAHHKTSFSGDVRVDKYASLREAGGPATIHPVVGTVPYRALVPYLQAREVGPAIVSGGEPNAASNR